jgi:predicted TIM-barrel fold metal-dependent hydrolase
MRRPEVPWLKKPPSEYMKSFYFGTQPLERVPHEKYLKYAFEMIEAERTLVFATDWPHSDFDAPLVIERMSFLSQTAKANILGLNAQQVLRFAGKGASKDTALAPPMAGSRT